MSERFGWPMTEHELRLHDVMLQGATGVDVDTLLLVARLEGGVDVEPVRERLPVGPSLAAWQLVSVSRQIGSGLVVKEQRWVVASRPRPAGR